LAFLDVESFIAGGRAGFALFSSNVLPVLFPFFLVTSLLVELDMFRRLPRLGVFVFGLVGGYPTSARILAELYERGQITRESAIRTATYSCVPSPIFMIATVGVALYGSVALGVMIFVSVVVGALFNGLLYRRITMYSVQTMNADKLVPREFDFARALQSSIQAILSVGGLIVVFFIMAHQVGAVFGLPSVLDVGFAGVLEMTTGVFRASDHMPHGISVGGLLVPVAILAFGGLCVGMQGFIFLQRIGMRFRFYLLMKVTHTVLSLLVGSVLLYGHKFLFS